jgi:hypothetical protein
MQRFNFGFPQIITTTIILNARSSVSFWNFSERNLASSKHADVKVVCIPQRGGERTARRKPTRGARSSKRVSAFAPASRGVSPCCSRSRHEALPRRGTCPFRAVGWCHCARKQSHEGTAAATVAQAKGRLIDPDRSFKVANSTHLKLTHGTIRNHAEKIGRRDLSLIYRHDLDWAPKLARFAPRN